MTKILPEDEERLIEEKLRSLKKRNRIKKLSPKIHKIHHESGRSTKNIWQIIVTKAQIKKK